MKIRVTAEFYDKFHTSTLFTVGTVLDFDDERANDIISKKLAVPYKEEKKTDPKKPAEPKKEEKKDEAPKVESHKAEVKENDAKPAEAEQKPAEGEGTLFNENEEKKEDK